ncbi:hypothetical protein V565_043960 [Rhizoctonia solani 123E]|uniref:MYND-type domain-containing protein n=1 Tax=Rhizoctonia solani 123E TaxID=1423351 RepID=A0A074RZV3_9AGAM|nr:hypothetical protein V565_043960 [Rhizoctonia solani 123E]
MPETSLDSCINVQPSDACNSDLNEQSYIMSRYDYLRKYASSDTWSPSTSPETVQQAQVAINAIRNSHDISATMLESVISLTYHFTSLAELLYDPGLVQDCILYLHRREREGVQVFDDENGYLCFRILVLAVNIWMISKYDKPALWYLLASKDGSEDADETLSKCIKLFLTQLRDDPDPDKTLGWDIQALHSVIISKGDALLLLDLLFKDRKGFLRAWSETRCPTLNGLLFLLRRSVHTPFVPAHLVSYIDLARRNQLASRENTDPCPEFEEDITNHAQIWFSTNAKTTVDLEDARTQLSLLTKQLHFDPVNPSPEGFAISAINLILHTLPNPKQGFVPGVEDLFVPLLGEIFRSTWNLLGVEFTREPMITSTLLRYLGAFVITINNILDHLIDHPAADVTAKEVLQVVVDSGVIEIMSKFIIYIDDYEGKYQISNDLRPFKLFGDKCHHILGPHGLNEMFEHTFIDWFKTLTYRCIHDGIYGTHSQHEEWFKKVIHFWRRLGDMLGHTFQEIQHEILVLECSYARCHDPQATRILALSCICGQAIYCGTRCQQMDWETHSARAHRSICN